MLSRIICAGVAVASFCSEAAFSQDSLKRSQASCAQLPEHLWKLYEHRDPLFVDPGCLSPNERSTLRTTKQSLIDAGVIPPCGSPSALPPDVLQQLMDEGVLSRLQVPLLTREQRETLSRLGIVAAVNPWFLTAAEKNELRAQGVPVPSVRSELPDDLEQTLIAQGALPRTSRLEMSTERWELLVRQGLVPRFSRYTLAFFENKEFCYRFHGRSVN